MRNALALILTVFAQIPPLSASGQTQPSTLEIQPGYADLADLALPASIVATAIIEKATRIGAKPQSAADSQRFLITARITTLIRGPNSQIPTINFLADIAPDVRGKLPKLKKKHFLIFADRVPGKPGQVQLLNRYSLLSSNPVLEQRVRAIVLEANAAGAAPAIRGIGSVFSVSGAVPGENETQIFLDSNDGRPVSLSVLRRPGEQPRWIVSLDEIVDEAAAYPVQDTLTWYRLACFLPPQLPDDRLKSIPDEQRATAAEDYALVLRQLGPCPRAFGK